MIVCPACNHKNPEGSEVCEACGASLEHFLYRACPSCGALNPAQNTFCHRCLSALVPMAQEAAPVEEDVAASVPAPVDIAEDQQPPSVDRTEIEEVETLVKAREEAQGEAEADLGTGGTEENEEAGPEEAREPLPDIIAPPLAGIDDLLPLEDVVSLPHRAAIPVPMEPTEADEHDAELFQRIAGEPAPLHEPARTILPKTVSVLPKTGRILLYLLVLLAALIPSFTGDLFGPWVRARESVAAAAQLFGTLPDDAVVLISFDYDPAYAGEMDPLALAVVRHLAKRSVRMVAMSTKPAGLGLAEQVYRTVSEETSGLCYGKDYAILGYLPGQESGLRTLAKSLGAAFKTDYLQGRPLADLSVTHGLTTINGFTHVIVLSDDSQIVRTWIEQVQSRNDIKLHALVTSRIEPMLIPYRESGQLTSLIAGSYGSIEYPVASGVLSRQGNLTDAYAGLFLVLFLTAVVTNVFYIGRAKRGGK